MPDTRPHPPVIIVDEQDNEIGAMNLLEAIEKEAIRRVVRIFLFDAKGRLFLQKRSPHVRLFPNTWDQSAAGHVDVGESYENAAARKLEEELGLSHIPMEKVHTFLMDESTPEQRLRAWNGIFRAPYNGENINFSQDEVEAGRWISVPDLEHEMRDKPDTFAAGFLIAWKECKQYLLK